MKTLFDAQRLQMTDAIRLTLESLATHAAEAPDWVVAWSGGKDSTALVTFVAWAIDTGRVPRLRSFSVLYADTRVEIPPLWIAAQDVRRELADRGVDVRVVLPPVEKRLLPYVLGRGVPPPNNNTLRYCTRQTKIDPMRAAVAERFAQAGRRVLMLTGVRLGESAARDQRIALSCSRDGAECGQGWFQREFADSPTVGTLAPLLHWRVCHVWEWLRHWAPLAEYGDWSTALLADAYGGDEAEEVNARTGCICCPLAHKDTALNAVCRMRQWSYLEPLKRMRELYRALREPSNRLRKPGVEVVGGQEVESWRMGPLTLDARRWGLEFVLGIQAEVNAAAARSGRPLIDIFNAEEEAYVRGAIAAGLWPRGWDGTEPRADTVREAGQKPGLFDLFTDEGE